MKLLFPSLFPPLRRSGEQKMGVSIRFQPPIIYDMGPPTAMYGEICSPFAHFELSQVVNPCLH